MFILNDGSLICLFVCGYGIIHHCYSVYVYIFVYLIDIIFDCCCFYLFLTICREKKNFNKFLTTDQMSINLFHTFLLLLFITCCACQCVYADKIAPSGGSKSVELFKTNELISNIIKPENGGGKGDGENITPSAFYLPLIVATDDVMVALTGVNRTDDSDKHVDILTKYITTKEEGGWPNKITTDAGWKTQLAYKEDNNNKKNIVKGLAAAGKEKNIYLFLLNETEGGGGNDQNCGIKLVEGTISTENAETIKWQTKESVIADSEEFKKHFESNSPNSYLSASSVYLNGEKKKIVFVVRRKGKDDKNIYAFLSVDKTTGGEEGVKLSYVGMRESSCFSAFFPWGENIMMIPTHCGENNGKLIVNESSDMGKGWTTSAGLFSYFVNFLQDKNDFTATAINGSNILLFTQRKLKASKSTDSKNDVHVWFTDGNRVSTAGRIETDDNITSSRLLHTKNALFALHQNWDATGQKNITLTHLENQLNNITFVVTAWNKRNYIVQELFKSIVPSTIEPFRATDGLVGFLSGNSEGNNNSNWIDEYLYVNATVTNGERVDGGGFKFEGAGKNAKWPVGEKKEDQPYNFTDPGFTLVANVTIDAADSGKDNSVLGVGYSENGKEKTKNIGLLCTQGGQWKLTDNEGTDQTTVTNGKQCQQGSTYLVAVILNNGKLSVHIDGEELNVKENGISIEPSANIAHFYFGADINGEITANKNIESFVTVRNILLYNRPLPEDVIKQLKISKDEKPKQGSNTKIQNSGDVIKSQNDSKTASGSTNDKKGTSDQSNDTADNNGNNTGDEETLSSQPESSTVRNYVGVFVCVVVLAHALCVL